MVKIVFSDHARYQLRERNINKALVRGVLENPDRAFVQARIRAVKLFNKNRRRVVCVVIYEVSRGTTRVITAFNTTKIKKYI